MKTIEDIAPLVRFIEIFDEKVIVYANKDNLQTICEYLPLDWALCEIEENKVILQKDPKKVHKFDFVRESIRILDIRCKEKRRNNEVMLYEDLPPNLFSIIIGHENIKKIYKHSIMAQNPVHILLYGPPSTAKSLFMQELERLSGAILVLGGELTRAGLSNIIADYKPRFLLIDELDKIKNSSDISSLLSWMEHGRIIIGKYKNYRDVKGKGWVFAACNKINKFPAELLSRFLKFHLREYTDEEFKVIIFNVLSRENIEASLAEYIADKIITFGYKDVRDAIRVGRLSNSKEEVDEILKNFDCRYIN